MLITSNNFSTTDNTINATHMHYENNDGNLQLLQPPTTSFISNNNSTDANLDIDSEVRSQCSFSTTSSPHSTSGTLPLSTFDSQPAARRYRFPEDRFFESPISTYSLPLLPPSNMMYTDAWVGDNTAFAPKGNGRTLHNRESSLSSLGSMGPASPFSFNSSNPQIALNDASDSYQNLQMPDDQSYQLTSKAPSGASHDTFYANYPYSTDSTTVQAYASMLAPQKHRGDRSVGGGLLPPPDFPSGGSSNSRPASVASSEASDSPATPAAPEIQEESRRKTAGENFLLLDFRGLHDELSDVDQYLIYNAGIPAVPKLDRTMTDIFGDELYNPNWGVQTSAPAQPAQTSTTSPTHEMFVQRVQAANNQHLSVNTQSPMSSGSRGRSPFRQGSPLAPAPAQDFSQVPPNMRFNTAQQMRERRKAQEDATQALRQTLAQTTSSGPTQTISPKDAVLEFGDADNSNNFPLFPQQSSSGFDANQLAKATSQTNNFTDLSLDTTSFDNYLNTQIAQGMTMPQQYPFVAKSGIESSLPSASNGSFSMSSRVGSIGSVSPDTTVSASPRRPEHVGAEGGTYTCTYHGCTQRFETPALLQKHKREGHRQAHGLNTLRRPEGPTGSYFNTQAGPHKCERINPSTGKPCNTIFSRPYDLTRHEDTIHNGRKQKVRCDVCTEEKTFSRADALTRHYRVCHPDLEFPGKHRKRGGAMN